MQILSQSEGSCRQAYSKPSRPTLGCSQHLPSGHRVIQTGPRGMWTLPPFGTRPAGCPPPLPPALSLQASPTLCLVFSHHPHWLVGGPALSWLLHCRRRSLPSLMSGFALPAWWVMVALQGTPEPHTGPSPLRTWCRALSGFALPE